MKYELKKLNYTRKKKSNKCCGQYHDFNLKFLNLSNCNISWISFLEEIIDY